MAKEMAAQDVQSIGDIVKKHADKLGNGRCAFVVSGTLGFGLVRMYDLLGGQDIHKEIAVAELSSGITPISPLKITIEINSAFTGFVM